MNAKHTGGPWEVVRYGDGDSLVIHCSPDNRVCFMATSGRLGSPQEVIEANARLIAAAPELLGVAANFEIKGPDDDGFVWLVLHGTGTSGKAMFNLGRTDRIAAQVALLLEEKRRAVVAKVTGHGDA